MPFTRATDSATVMNTHALTKHYGDVHAVGGLDPAGIIEVRELLRRLAHKNGVTVLAGRLTTLSRLWLLRWNPPSPPRTAVDRGSL
jgi:hypothetical protein